MPAGGFRSGLSWADAEAYRMPAGWGAVCSPRVGDQKGRSTISCMSAAASLQLCKRQQPAPAPAAATACDRRRRAACCPAVSRTSDICAASSKSKTLSRDQEGCSLCVGFSATVQNRRRQQSELVPVAAAADGGPCQSSWLPAVGRPSGGCCLLLAQQATL